MATGRSTFRRTGRIQRPYLLTTSATLSDDYYDNCRDCSCHKLGRLRPHSPARCRDL